MRGWLRLAAVLAAALLCCGMAGCAPQATGAFYTLEEAYEAGFLTYVENQEASDEILAKARRVEWID